MLPRIADCDGSNNSPGPSPPSGRLSWAQMLHFLRAAPLQALHLPGSKGSQVPLHGNPNAQSGVSSSPHKLLVTHREKYSEREVLHHEVSNITSFEKVPGGTRGRFTPNIFMSVSAVPTLMAQPSSTESHTDTLRCEHNTNKTFADH